MKTPWIRLGTRRHYSVLLVGNVAIPSVLIGAIGAVLFLLFAVSMTLWDAAFGGNGMGFAVFSVVMGVGIGIGAVFVLIALTRSALRLLREVNGYDNTYREER